MPQYNSKLLKEQAKEKKEKELSPLEIQSKAEKEVFKGKPLSYHKEKQEFDKAVKEAERLVKSSQFDLNKLFGVSDPNYILEDEYQQAVELLKQNKKLQSLFLRKLNDYAGTYNIDNPKYLIKLSLDNVKRNVGEYIKRQGKKFLRATARQIPLATVFNPSLKQPLVKSNLPLERFPVSPYESISISGMEFNFPPGEVKRYKKGTNIYAIEYNNDGTPKTQIIGDETFLVPDKSGVTRVDPESAKFAASQNLNTYTKGGKFDKDFDFSKYDEKETYIDLEEGFMYKLDLIPATSQEKVNYKIFNDAAKKGLIAPLYISRIDNKLYASESPDTYLNSSNMLMSSIDEIPVKKVISLAFDKSERLNIVIAPAGISRENPRKFQEVGATARIAKQKDYRSMWAYVYDVKKFKILDEKFKKSIKNQNDISDSSYNEPDEGIRQREIEKDPANQTTGNVKFASDVEKQINKQRSERKENPFFLSGVSNFNIKNKLEADGFSIENSRDLREYYETKLKELNIKMTPKLLTGIKKMYQIVDDFYDKIELYNQNTKGNKIPIDSKTELFNYMTKLFYLNTFEKMVRNIGNIDVDTINLKSILRGGNVKEDYSLSSLYSEILMEQEGQKLIDVFIEKYLSPNKKKTNRYKDKEKLLNILGKKLSEDVYNLINEIS
jgi:hypothetical protein